MIRAISSARMQSGAQDLAAYCPGLLARYLQDDERGPDVHVPEVFENESIVLFADISGFTALTEKLQHKGPFAAQLLARYLNSYIQQLVRLYAKAGGDVFKFAGDAQIVVWPVYDSALSTARRAIQCALDVQKHQANAQVGPVDDPVTLNIKIGIGYGNVKVVLIGGVENGRAPRLEYIATGPPLIQAFDAEAHCATRQVVCTNQVLGLSQGNVFVENFFEAERPPIDPKHPTDEKWYGGHVVLGRRPGSKPIRMVNTATSLGPLRPDSTYLRRKLWQFVPRAVAPFLDKATEKWASELRRVTTVFVNLGFREEELNRDFTPDTITAMNEIFRDAQRAVYENDGSINKFLVDDKGSTMIAIWGRPAHENDAIRAVITSLRICSVLKSKGRRGSIGITTGVAFCGVVGHSGTRREYSILGESVNLAARLMSFVKHHGSQGGVCNDLNTKLATRGHMTFQSLGAHPMKGIAEPVRVYCPSVSVDSVDGGSELEDVADVSSRFTDVMRTQIKLYEKSSPLHHAAAEARRISYHEMLSHPKELSGNDNASSTNSATSTTASQTKTVLPGTAGERKVPNISRVKAMRARRRSLSIATPRQRRSSFIGRAIRRSTGLDRHDKLPEVQLVHISLYHCDGSCTVPVSESECTTVGQLRPAVAAQIGQLASIADPIFCTPDDHTLLHDAQALATLTRRMKDLASQQRAAMGEVNLLVMARSDHERLHQDLQSIMFPHLQDQQNRLHSVTHDLVSGSGHGIVLVRGPAGIGKTQLLNDVFFDEPTHDYAVAIAQGNPLASVATPAYYFFGVWRQIIQDLMQQRAEALPSSSSIPAGSPRRDILQGFVASLDLKSASEPTRALLHEILEIPYKRLSAEATSNISEQHLDEIADFLFTILGSVIGDAPTVAIIDDAQYVDPSSWKLAIKLSQANPHLLMVVSLREDFGRLAGEESSPYYGLIKYVKANGQEIALTSLPIDAAARLAVRELGVHKLGKMLKHFMYKRTEGNPMYIQELCDSLVSVDLIHVGPGDVDGDGTVSAGGGDGGSAIKRSDHTPVIADFKQETRTVLSGGGRHKRGSSVNVIDVAGAFEDLDLVFPVPASAAAQLNSKLDLLDTQMLLLLKTAALVGNQDPESGDFEFAMALATSSAIFPIPNVAPASLYEDAKALHTQHGILIPSRFKGSRISVPGESKTSDFTHYTFRSGFLCELLKQRMLESQRIDMAKRLHAERERQNDHRVASFMERLRDAQASSPNISVVKMEGEILVLKDNKSMLAKGWKRRWCGLRNDRLIQYYSDHDPREVFTIYLAGARCESTGERIQNKDNCFQLHAQKWVKKGKMFNEPKTFHMRTRSTKDTSEWVFKISCAILALPTSGSQTMPPRSMSANDDMLRPPVTVPVIGRANSVAANIHTSKGIAEVREPSSPDSPDSPSNMSDPPPRLSQQLSFRLSSLSENDWTAVLSDSEAPSSPASPRVSDLVWVQLVDPVSSQPYYWCKSSGETCWNRPEDGHVVSSESLGITAAAQDDYDIIRLTSEDYSSINSYWESYGLRSVIAPHLLVEHHLGDIVGLGIKQKQGQLLGFLLGRTIPLLGDSDSRSHIGLVVQVAVFDSWRRRGIGSSLLRAFEDQIQTPCYGLCATIEDDEAYNFLRACGFESIPEDEPHVGKLVSAGVRMCLKRIST